MKKIRVSNKMTPLFGLLLACVLVMCVKMDASAANTQPTELKQTAAVATKVSISWKAPADSANNFNRYIVQCSKDNKVWVDKGYVASDVTSANLVGMERGTSWYVRIKAMYYDATLKKYTVDGAWSEAIEVATIPYSVTGITQTAATKTSVTFTWPEATGANCYDVYVGTSYSKAKFVVRMTGRTLTVKGKKQGSAYYVKVVPVRMTAQKFSALGMDSYGTVKTTPKSVVVSGESSWERGTKSIDFTWSSSNKIVDGYQVKIYNNKGKLVKSLDTKKTYYTYTKASSKYYYKIKVRPYITVDGKKKYGAWSKVGAALMQPQVTGVTQEDEKAVISWSPVTGAAGYDIYAGTYPDVTSMTKIGEAGSGDTSFTTTAIGETKVASNKRVYFCVKAKKTIKSKVSTSIASNAGFSN